MDTTKAENVTRKHIARVQELLGQAAIELIQRGAVHDQSKFHRKELLPLQAMEELNAREGKPAFGTPAYEERKATLGSMIQHHYQHNTHHPEHFDDGVDGMNLFDVLEMLLDWKAAAERDGEETFDVRKRCKRYDMSVQLTAIMLNTSRSLGFE